MARDLSTDRPDQTESPYTVDRGRYQAEFHLAAVARDFEGARPSWQFIGLNLKRGLSGSTDIQIVAPGLESIPTAGGRESGFGDVALRLKWNAKGNDADGFAYGFMPFVSFPTGGEGFTAGGFEGGLIVPAAFPLTERIGMGVMAEGDIVRDADGSGAHAEVFFTATVSRDLRGPLGGFVELTERLRPEAEGKPESMLDIGTTYSVGEDLQLDAGVQWGWSGPEKSSAIFVGFSARR